MKKINIAGTLIVKRCVKGITQDELANFIGVSKASVSKWERGHSYPDITYLPQLAAYFDISIDELMGYKSQMTNDDIRALYEELSNEFAAKPCDEVMNRCLDIVKKYYSCFPLLFQIGMLFLNYSHTFKNDEKKAFAILEAKELFVRVKTLCDSIELKSLALQCEAVCEIMLDKTTEVITLLEHEKKHFSFHPSVGVMLSQSYKMLGEIQEAKITMQDAILNSIIALFYDIPYYLDICTDNKDYFEEVCRRTIAMIEIFNAKEVSPMAILPFYIAAATGYLAFDDTEKSLSMIETYTEIVTGDIIPLTILKGDNFFTLIDELRDKTLREFPFGFPNLPLNEQSFKQTLVEAIVENTAYSTLADNPRYKSLSEKLKSTLSE